LAVMRRAEEMKRTSSKETSEAESSAKPSQFSQSAKCTCPWICCCIARTEDILWRSLCQLGCLYCLLNVNQSINLFVRKCNKHWTGHQARMQPPLTGAHKTKLVRAKNENT